MTDTNERGIAGTVSGATCAEACWMAKEDICVCECGGVNHGLGRVEGEELPARRKRSGRRRLELRAVVIGYREAGKFVREANPEHPNVRSIEYAKEGEFVVQAAPLASFGKWPELEGLEPGRWRYNRPHLVWECVEVLP